MPTLFRKVKDVKSYLKSLRSSGGNNLSVGFVPTMGYLHEGHMELIKKCKLQNDITVVSIYVNPLQFGEGEDYQKYPRDLERDLAMCQEAGVDVVFAPTDEEVYPQVPKTKIHVEGISHVLEGAFRPNHFSGVALIVLKLFNIIQPDRAYFGEKDFQQLKLIQRLVNDLSYPVEIVPVPTVRDKDGLALSSRNTYLKEQERESALSIYRSFLIAQKLFRAGNTKAQDIKEAVRDYISRHPHVKRIDYVEIVDEDFNIKEEVSEGDRVLVAVWIGDTRLIDNWRLSYEEV
ncbi:pantoate/beta-alanine ligase [Hydrogenobacter thermophilus TK-6]|uniref:Pantothenate synthetase n=1 Tax=Hydrogenobacter thermophilus (strain DSM 6534 / IAM 12695 / TK-6) TaxID=608538 RepID=D3DH06_HYDTT|nr:pantoate--beta-alanine ligase [Hydrogenobacter thermophilus]ADO45043.1 pantoate/beta-alanine ligase [Hydrogenobacter thermophilus TK-6]BAI69108.1 panthothenate synthetase [Hydrogenobacter thermophilus TK-6]